LGFVGKNNLLVPYRLFSTKKNKKKSENNLIRVLICDHRECPRVRAEKIHLGCGIISRISALQDIFCTKKQEKSSAENVKCFTGSLRKAKVARAWKITASTCGFEN